MTELTDKKAINIALMFYGQQKFNADDAGRIVASLSRADVIGLVRFAYEQGKQEAQKPNRDYKVGFWSQGRFQP